MTKRNYKDGKRMNGNIYLMKVGNTITELLHQSWYIINERVIWWTQRVNKSIEIILIWIKNQIKVLWRSPIWWNHLICFWNTATYFFILNAVQRMLVLHTEQVLVFNTISIEISIHCTLLNDLSISNIIDWIVWTNLPL